MILINFFIGFCALFISPQIYLYYKYPTAKYSIVFTVGFVFSLSLIWILVILAQSFNIQDIYFQVFAYLSFLASLVVLFQNRKTVVLDRSHVVYLCVISFALLTPLYFYVGDVFTAWDAVVSWNRWAMDLAQNQYQPEGTAYPVFIPAVWAILYKMQGTVDIWWTAKLSLYIFPFVTIFVILNLFYETKNKFFLLVLLLLFPYFASSSSISGYVDTPVMLIGMLSLIFIYSAEMYRGKHEFAYYVYMAILIAGISVIIKQSGLVFLVFCIVYIVLNYKEFRTKSIILFLVASLFYAISFMVWFLMYSDSLVGNLDYLQKLSASNTANDLFKFLVEPNRLAGLFTLVMIGLGFYLYKYKELRELNSPGFLSGVFFIAGCIIWWSYFSYDGRNSIWVKSFLIFLFAVNFNYYFMPKIEKVQWFQHWLVFIIGLCLKVKWLHKRNFLMVVPMIGLAAILAVYAIGVSKIDYYVYKVQEIGQSKIGNSAIATKVVSLVNSQKECIRIVSPVLPLFYNYYSRDIKDRYIYGSFSEETLKHDCSDGRFYVFGEWEKKSSHWNSILNAEEKGVIVPVGNKSDLIYFAPFREIGELDSVK